MWDQSKLNKLELENDEPKIDESSLQEEAVAFSVKIVETLSAKANQHNEICNNKVNINELKEVYLRGARECNDSNLGQAALARVNMFLRLKAGDQISLGQEFETDSESIDISDGWIPSEQDYERASQEIEKLDLSFSFSSVDDLYIENYERIEWEW